MDTATAAKTFSLLSIGDGLITQIPALLISITAGIVTTRVTSERSENLGSEISSQILKQPKALMIAAAFLMGMALVPGFPKPPFLILSAALGLIGYALWSRDQQQKRQRGELCRPEEKQEARSIPLFGDIRSFPEEGSIAMP